jgi:4-hydroxybenzoate polyprenyltransferase
VPVWQGALIVPVLLACSAALAATQSADFHAVLAVYLAITLAYSVNLKNRPIFDVIVLACLYTLRVIAGAAATQIQPSFWLLAFSLFLFLSLALVKRYSELRVVLARAEHMAAGRGYDVTDLPLLAALGVAAGMSACLVLALYLNSPEVLRMYAAPWLLWAIVPLVLHWICRIWMKTHRGLMHDDPVVFAARDRQSLIIVALAALIMALASQAGR